MLGSGGLYLNTTGAGAGGGGGYFPSPSRRSSIDLGDEPLRRSGDWMMQIRVGMERMKMGLRDGMKLDRSLGLVWGLVLQSVPS